MPLFQARATWRRPQGAKNGERMEMAANEEEFDKKQGAEIL